MDPDKLLKPSGPLPAATYWRRRMLLLAVVIVAVVLVVRACAGGGNDRLDEQGAAGAASLPPPSAAPGGAQPSAGATTAATRTSPTPAAPGGTGLCADSDLVLSAMTDRPTYARGATARLTLLVRNASPRACRRDLGQAQREVVVTSGNDRIWSSDDCMPGGKPAVVTLLPGQTAAFGVDWPTVRSRPGCPPGQPRALAGTYKVNSRLGGVQSEAAVFRVS